METHAFFAIFKKELRSVIKERTILIAILIQLFIASFSSALLMGLMSVYDPQAVGLSNMVSVQVGIVGETSGPLVGFLRARNANVIPFATLADAETAFYTQAIDAAIFVPEEEGPIVNIQLFLPESETRSTVTLMILREPLKQYESYLREQNDIHIRYTDVEGLPATTYEFQYAVIIPLLMFFPAFVTGGMVVDSISEELADRTLETLWSVPLSLSTIFGAKIGSALVLAGGQCFLWAALLRLNGIAIQNLGLVLAMAVISAAIIAVGAASIAAYFKDRERSQFVYALFILLSVSLSYFFDFSPIALITRLATGGNWSSVAGVAVYGLLLLALLTAFLSTTKKLIAVVN